MQTILQEYATLYNRMENFECDPIIFPRHFASLMQHEKSTLADVEIAGIIAAHLAWGRREMIVRDCRRAFDEMEWRPYDYVMAGSYKSDSISLHRTIKWSEFATICANLKQFYLHFPSLEPLTPQQIRVDIYGMKPDLNCANKKIHMFRRWMVRNDGIVDIGVWKKLSPKELIIPLDVHVHRVALDMGLTKRKSADAKTAAEITEKLKQIFPNDPCLGDFALFGYGVTHKKNKGCPEIHQDSHLESV